MQGCDGILPSRFSRFRFAGEHSVKTHCVVWVVILLFLSWHVYGIPLWRSA